MRARVGLLGWREHVCVRSRESATRHLADLGLLGPDLTHWRGVWLTDDELDLVAGTP